MISKALITAHFATSAEVASRLRIPRDRVAELQRRYYLVIVPNGARTVARSKAAAKKTKAIRRVRRSSTKRAAARAKKK